MRALSTCGAWPPNEIKTKDPPKKVPPFLLTGAWQRAPVQGRQRAPFHGGERLQRPPATRLAPGVETVLEVKPAPVKAGTDVDLELRRRPPFFFFPVSGVSRRPEARPRTLTTKRCGDVFWVGVSLGFVWLTTRTTHPHGACVRGARHGAYARGARRNRIDPHRGEIERLTTRTPGSSCWEARLSCGSTAIDGRPSCAPGNSSDVIRVRAVRCPW